MSTTEDEEKSFPYTGILKCNLCKREIPATITSKEGLSKFNNFDKIHNDCETLFEPCGGIVKPKNKKKDENKEDKNKDSQEQQPSEAQRREESDIVTFDNIVKTKSIMQAIATADRYFYKNIERKIKSKRKLMILYGSYGLGKSTFLKAVKNEKKYKKCKFEKLSTSVLMPGKIGEVEDAIGGVFSKATKLYYDEGITTVFTMDEKEILFNDKSDKSSKELAMVTASLLSHIGGEESQPGYFLIVATNREFDIEGAGLDRAEKIYFSKLDTDESIEFLKMYLGKTNIRFNDNINYKNLVQYVEDFNGRNYDDISELLSNWYMDNIDNGQFSNDHVITQEELVCFLNDYKLKLKAEEKNRKARKPRRKQGRPISDIDDDDITQLHDTLNDGQPNLYEETEEFMSLKKRKIYDMK